MQTETDASAVSVHDTDSPDTEAATPVHPGDRSMGSWRARLAVMASRGEVDGPRVAEARRALAYHRDRRYFDAEVQRGALSREAADSLVDILTRHRAEAGQPDAEAVEAVSR